MSRRDEVITTFRLIMDSSPMSLIGPPDSLFFSSLLDSVFADEYPSRTMSLRDEVITTFQLIVDSSPMSLVDPLSPLFFSSLLDSVFPDENGSRSVTRDK
ncbi:hypothetical protein NU219Hw_g6587t1 [Hortaea werneckii]